MAVKPHMPQLRTMTKYHHLLGMLDEIFAAIEILNGLSQDGNLATGTEVVKYLNQRKTSLEEYILGTQRIP